MNNPESPPSFEHSVTGDTSFPNSYDSYLISSISQRIKNLTQEYPFKVDEDGKINGIIERGETTASIQNLLDVYNKLDYDMEKDNNLLNHFLDSNVLRKLNFLENKLNSLTEIIFEKLDKLEKEIKSSSSTTPIVTPISSSPPSPRSSRAAIPTSFSDSPSSSTNNSIVMGGYSNKKSKPRSKKSKSKPKSKHRSKNSKSKHRSKNSKSKHRSKNSRSKPRSKKSKKRN